jgi:hypothetical protein
MITSWSDKGRVPQTVIEFFSLWLSFSSFACSPFVRESLPSSWWMVSLYSLELLFLLLAEEEEDNADEEEGGWSSLPDALMAAAFFCFVASAS